MREVEFDCDSWKGPCIVAETGAVQRGQNGRSIVPSARSCPPISNPSMLRTVAIVTVTVIIAIIISDNGGWLQFLRGGRGARGGVAALPVELISPRAG